MMIKAMAAAVCAAAALPATLNAQINSPEAAGYLERGIQMYADGNYNGCLDQLTHMRLLDPTMLQSEEAHYYSAMATMGQGDDEALAMLRTFLARFPQSPRRQMVLTTIGDYFFTRAQYADAVRAYLKVDPATLASTDADTRNYRLAYSYLMLAEYDKAEPLFDTLSKSAEYANAATFYKAYIAYCRKDFPRAMQLFKDVDTSRQPGNTADYYLAQLYFNEGNYKQALASARRIITADPVPELTVETRRIAGESLYNLGNPAEATPYLWQYVAEASEQEPSAFYILGVEEYNGGDYAAAIKLLQKAVDANNSMAQSAYLYLGQSYLKQGNTNNALMAFENAYRMNYDPKVQETAFYNYAVARSEGGRAPFSSSVAVMEDFLRQYPNSRYADDVEKYLVNGYMTSDDYPAALAAINRITNPDKSILKAKQRVLLVLGSRECQAGQTALALMHLKEARSIADGDSNLSTEALLWMGDCYYAEEKWDEAAQSYLDYLEATPATAPNRRLTLYNLGYTRYNQHRYADALIDFRRACEASGDLSKTAVADCRMRMGDCYAYEHDWSAAAAEYSRAYDMSPNTADYALYRMAAVKGYSGDFAQQIQLLDKMMDRFPTSGLAPAALLDKAEAYTAQGSTAKAIATYNQLVRDYPQSSYGRNGQLQLAITYLNKGDRASAIEAYRKVIYTYPTSDEARVAADDLKQIYAQDGRLSDYTQFMRSVPNAPQVDPGEIESLAYETASQAYLSDNGTARLKSYLRDYPQGTYRPEALYYLAEDAEDAGRYDEAYGYVSEIMLGYPDAEVAEDALAIKASCELHEGKGEIALESYRQLEQKASTPAMLAQARIQLMRVARDLGRDTEVLTTTEKLLSSTATNPGINQSEILFTRALSLNRLHRTDEAWPIWSDLAKDPNDIFGAKSAYYLAQSRWDAKQPAAAEAAVTALVDSDTPHDYWRARGVILLSDILRARGETFEADQYLRAIRNNYNDPNTTVEINELVDRRLK